jgi:high-affinity K+ transport system ATPase subunit B
MFMKKISKVELLILLVTVSCIFFSEYLFLIKNDSNKAIFIGLWPPTILGLLNYINSKRK